MILDPNSHPTEGQIQHNMVLGDFVSRRFAVFHGSRVLLALTVCLQWGHRNRQTLQERLNILVFRLACFQSVQRFLFICHGALGASDRLRKKVIYSRDRSFGKYGKPTVETFSDASFTPKLAFSIAEDRTMHLDKLTRVIDCLVSKTNLCEGN